MMPSPSAAKAFLRDAYEREHGRAPSDEDLTAWAIQQWAQVRQQAPLMGISSADLLKRLAPPSSKFPGLTGGKA